MRCGLRFLLLGTGLATGGLVLVTGDQPSLAREMVAAHNRVRRDVGVPPLEWSQPLAERAQDWAARLLGRGQLVHRPGSKFGENLFAITGAPATPAQVVGAWADEFRAYDYSTNQCRGVCGHYTQVVWKDSKKVGCGVARGRGREVWVCNYDPPGNWAGQRPY